MLQAVIDSARPQASGCWSTGSLRRVIIGLSGDPGAGQIRINFVDASINVVLRCRRQPKNLP